MVDEDTISTNERYRWPVLLFLAPVVAILMSGQNSEVDAITIIAMGVVFVCGGLRSVWFGGLSFDGWSNRKSHMSFIFHFLQTILAGIFLASGWQFALKKFGEGWGVNSDQLGAEIASISAALFQLLPTVGMISFVIYWGAMTLAGRWAPVVDDIPIWTKKEAVWGLTTLSLILLYSALAFFIWLF